MFFIFLGIFAIVLTTAISKVNPSLKNAGRTGRVVGLLMILLGASTSCFVQIEPGEVGVKTLFGKIQEGTLTEGLNFVNPLVAVEKFDVRTQNYTMSSVRDEGVRVGDDAIRVLTADGLEVIIDLSVLYHIMPDKAPDILRSIGGREVVTDKIIRPLARTKIRDNAVFYDAVSLYSTKRDEFQAKITQNIEKDFSARGIELENILIRNITLPESVKLTIESKINAEQEAQKMKFVLEKERQEAERKRVEAQGIADYQRILTSTLTDKLLQYEQIKAQKELANSPNSKVVVMGAGKSAPILIGQ
jgi:regulator of protease activity HflC (stomatin/prohibitin superfamily)